MKNSLSFSKDLISNSLDQKITPRRNQS